MTHSRHNVFGGPLLVVLWLCYFGQGHVPAQTLPAARQYPELVVQAGSALSPSVIVTEGAGEIAAVGDRQSIAVWAISARSQIRTIWPDRPFESIALSPDGHFVAAALRADPANYDQANRAGKVVLWDVATGKRAFVFEMEEEQQAVTPEPSAVAFSPDGTRLAIGSAAGGVSVIAIAGRDDARRQFPPKPAVRVLAGPKEGRVTRMGFDRAGTNLVFLTSAGYVGAVDIANRQLRFKRRCGDDPSAALAVAPTRGGVVIGTKKGEVALVDAAYGREEWRVSVGDGKHPRIDVAAVSTDENVIAVGTGFDLVLLNARTGETKWRAHNFTTAGTLALGSNASQVLSPVNSGFPEIEKLRRVHSQNLYGVGIWDGTNGALVGLLDGVSSTIEQAEFGPDGTVVAVVSDSFKIWSLKTGQMWATLPTGSYGGGRVAFAKDFSKHFSIPAGGASFSDDASKLAFTAASYPLEGEVEIRDVTKARTLGDLINGKLLCKVPGTAPLEFDPLGRWVAVCQGASLKLWDIRNPASPKLMDHFDDAPRPEVRSDSYRKFAGEAKALGLPTPPTFPRIKTVVRVSPDSSMVAVGYADGDVVIHDVSGTRPPVTLSTKSVFVDSLDFSRAADALAAGCIDGSIHVWSTMAPYVDHILLGHTARVRSVRFDNGGRLLVSASWDGTMKLWDLKSRSPIASLVDMGYLRWAVVAPDGRFDADDLDEVGGLHWVFPDDPFRAQAPEAFMRDYYEPRLLPRLLAGQTLRAIRPLHKLNRAEPRLTNMRTMRAGAGDRLTVTVDVAQGWYRAGTPGGQEWSTETYDLRLFRDGQLIGQCPEPAEDAEPLPDGTTEAELEKWRNATLVSPNTDSRVDRHPDGSATVRFEVRLPHRPGQTVKFTAYAFNRDRVKGGTIGTEYPCVADPKSLGDGRVRRLTRDR